MGKEKGRRAAQDSPVAAAAFVRRRAQAMRADRPALGPRRAEYEALVEWSVRCHKQLDFHYVEKFERVSEGAEHVVHYDPARRRAIKAAHVNRFGHSARDEGIAATPLEYLRRLGWHNLLFGDDIRVEGIAYEEEQLEVITSQPWITAHRTAPNPTQQEISAYLSELNFLYVPLSEYAPLYFSRRFGLVVADAHDRNVLRDEHGYLSPIDVVIGYPDPPLRRRIEFCREQAR
jgi:serine/threonin/tyrosin kinase-like protein